MATVHNETLQRGSGMDLPASAIGAALILYALIKYSGGGRASGLSS